jgi:hypothetical protein
VNIVAQLDGRDDIHQSWNCVGDHELEIRFDFPPKPEPRSKTITVVEPGKETVTVVRESIPVENVSAKPITNRNHWSLWFGPNVTFGVAPSPAYGLSVSSAYNFSKWSMMLGARGAYAFGPIERNPFDVISFSGIGGSCYRERWFNACAFLSVNAIKSFLTRTNPDNFELRPQVTPGIGLGISGRHSMSRKIGLYLSGEASILSRDVEIATLRETIWIGGQFLGSISVGVELTP